jgi:diadenosine tetraphosphate (Ap4A) HIT family hydrolase
MVAVKKIGAAIDLEHGGYNVIVNNGLEAGQYIIHTHFHIIPRRGGDDITVEGWDRPGISKERFMEINEKLKRQIAG